MPPPHAAVDARATVSFGLRVHGERPALITTDGTVSYRDLADRVDDVADRLGPQPRLVMIAASNAIEPVTAYLAALSGGHPVLLVPGDNAHTTRSLSAVYDPDVVVGDDGTGRWDIVERRHGTAHRLHPDLALLLTTSGSTGSPKLVRLSHENVRSNAAAIADYLDIDAADRAATTLPMHYCYGLSVINSHLMRGAGLILTDMSVVDRCFWEMFREHRGTTFAGVPYTFEQLDRVGFDAMSLPTLRYVTQAGGRLAPGRVRAYAELGRARGWQFVVMYGQTEATARMAYLPPELAADHPGAIGRAIPGGSFSLRPVDGNTEPDVGELVYEGPNVMLGYAEGPADLSVGRTVDVLHTGDLARRGPSGLYEIVGRRSRIAKVFGLRIDLARVEDVLADAGVHAWAADGDDALVVATDGDHVEQVRQVCRDVFGLPGWSVRVCVAGEPPRLDNGKIDYPALVRMAGTTPPSEPPAEPDDPDGPAPGPRTKTDELRDLYAVILGRSDVTDDSTFVGLDGDSLSYVEMSIRLEEALGTLPPDWHTTPIRDLVPSRRQSAWKRVDTGVMIRAAAIVAIVGTHAQLFTVLGGAHALLAVAGFNFGRFRLTSSQRPDRIRGLLTSVARIAVPSMVWIGATAALSDDYTLANALLLNGVLGPDRWTPQWHFWFIEAIVYILAALTLVLAVPAIDRIERRWPFRFALAFVAVGLLTRFVVDSGTGPRLGIAPVIFWLFAVGWAAAKATGRPSRLMVSVVVAATVPGFFDDPARDAVVIAAILLVIWVPSVPVPAVLVRLSGALAAGSLYIYLTHWQVYSRLDDYSPLLAVIASLAVGIGYGTVVTAALRRWSHRRDTVAPLGEAAVLGGGRRQAGDELGP